MEITLHHQQDAHVLTDMCQIAVHSSDTIACTFDRVRLATSLCFQQRLLADEATFKYSFRYTVGPLFTNFLTYKTVSTGKYCL